jgi:hypothetical protein
MSGIGRFHGRLVAFWRTVGCRRLTWDFLRSNHIDRKQRWEIANIGYTMSGIGRFQKACDCLWSLWRLVMKDKEGRSWSLKPEVWSLPKPVKFRKSSELQVFNPDNNLQLDPIISPRSHSSLGSRTINVGSWLGRFLKICKNSLRACIYKWISVSGLLWMCIWFYGIVLCNKQFG